MEKYGVEETQEKTAEPKKDNKCPDCGADLRPADETGVLLCKKCGSRPFEER